MSGLACLDAGSRTVACAGAVEHRPRPSDGQPFVRCEAHYTERYFGSGMSELERYSNSAVAPAGFDPEDIGERWDDD